MTLFKSKLLPLLLALLMVVTMLPVSALAAEIPEETTTVCTDEYCAHNHTDEISAPDDTSEPASIEKAPMVGEATEAETPEATTPVDTPDVTEETPETPKVDELLTVETPAPENPETPEVPTKAIAYSGYIGDSAVAWTFNAETGRLFISGSGYVEPFFSEDDRPWRELREKITSVRFDLASSMEITDLCYWFDGCINLSDAAIPVNVCQLCPEDFAVCPALNTLTYGGVDVLVEITMDYSNQAAAYSEQGDADGGISLFSSSNCGVTRCTCTGSCSYGYRNYRVAPESNNYHIMTVYCATCGMTDGIIVSGNHSYSSNGYCSLCGYYNSAYDTSVCYHTSTYTTWSGCNWTKYCSNCGAYISSGTSHGSTYTTWNGCNWYEYCRDCGQLMDSGTSHSYSYGGWEYYNSSRHRRTGTCTSCGATTYSYGYHSTSTQYSQYSSTQHSYGSYCSTCASYVGSVSYANHNFSYGSWQNYNGTQHRRLKTCATCGYSEYEYSSHSLSYGSWTNYSASQHRRTVSCSTCGYNSYEYASHSLTYGAWASISDTQHRRTLSCSCGYGTTETGAHTDADDNGYCDDCEYLMTRFSVTVPASLSLTVSEHGTVYAADNAAIVNNSTGAVAVTGVTVNTANGWTLVPYRSNMAAAKVDTKLIGFSLNNAQSAVAGTSENLLLPGAWQIAKGASLPLSYGAVVSAMSQPVSEQVLTVIFVLDWAA
ncbi:MAG: hypothetical protein EOM37_11960 [Proteobacteria bacterium]|nr:hypothetical protein [Pseudomonadota bacterium]